MLITKALLGIITSLNFHFRGEENPCGPLAETVFPQRTDFHNIVKAGKKFTSRLGDLAELRTNLERWSKEGHYIHFTAKQANVS